MPRASVSRLTAYYMYQAGEEGGYVDQSFGTMDRRGFLGALGAAGALSVLDRVGLPRAEVVPRAQNVVLVHGLYADGSSWDNVIGLLQDAGLKVTSVQNPLTSLAESVAATRRALAVQQGPIVLAGHSWSGTIVSEVGDDPKISALVYVAARAPDAGEDFPALAKTFPAPPASAGVVITDGFAQLSEMAFMNDFANGVEPRVARRLYAVQASNVATLTTEKTTAAAWRGKPSWYAVSKQDRTINPELERFLAKRMNATTIEVDSGHLSLVSHPREIADLILAAAGLTLVRTIR
ncbi:MAG TPA: alpha/beta hydrolase [Gemmatimonadaceae bacterium]|nr:alpha/beta hydrolase [Gemmatimonadaceae bacterium]